MIKVSIQVLHWWGGISVREQRLMLMCGAVLLAGGIYWGIIQPLTERSEQARQQLQDETQLLNWVTDKADRITALRRGGTNVPSVRPLNQLVSSAAGSYGIELIRMQPRDGMLQVWIKPVAFNRLIRWLAQMKDQQGIDVVFMDISATNRDGVVEIKRLQLKRGS
ncbi:general secretion pathway protein GspM [Vibrio sp. HA2012]|uniref:type II secretion system protein M n=1 Tax=Vibrio sp. HA2012 TaxID=1971595 RepID=UPI000C2B7500|nr:type II secretion system protein M [Vibrio sp. HA2012]PJC85085.1 general secretion pathway protein GspM [Vibrio sp. HA2012]